MSGEHDWIQSLKAGDEVFITGHYSAPDSPARISRVSPSRVFILVNERYEQAYHKKNGRSVGSDAWHFSNIVESTEERRERWSVYKLRLTATDMIKRIEIPKDRVTIECLIGALKPFVKETHENP